jgi:hypothetical protein
MSEVVIGDVIQIDPEHDPVFGGCFGIVEEVKPWGCSLVACPAPGAEGIAYYRVAHGKYAVIGRTEWITSDRQRGEDSNE